ncbi:Nucleolar protein 6 [Blattella germanica]|nr:Nucleolar protein 6 [Blattella germanica]
MKLKKSFGVNRADTKKAIPKEEEPVSSEEELDSDDSGEGGDYNVEEEDDDVEEEEEEEEQDEQEDEEESDDDPEDSGVDAKKVSLKRKADENDDEGATKKKKKQHKSEDARLLRAPTVKELNQLRETENLFHSNLFRLQIQEVLKEVQVRAVYKSLLEKWVEDFKKELEDLKESPEYDLNELKWLKKLKVKLPLHQFPHTPGVFKFVKPKSVSLIGSYRGGCCLGPNARVDVEVEAMEGCFDARDFLNHRYHRKRALYLAYIAGKLRKSSLVEEMHFVQSCSNPLKPVLEVKPTGKLGKRVLLVVHVVPPTDIFKLSRFSPVKNNVRPHWYFEEETAVPEDQLMPTPHYNCTVLRDLVMKTNNEYSADILEKHPNLRDGILLLKVWLKQRGLDQGYGCFSGYIMSMYVLHLLQSRHINSAMSSYQVARNAWSHLGQSDWTTEGISLAEKTPLSDFHQHFEVVFVDVKQECILAMKCLDSPGINSFQALFMTKMPFYRQFDHILRISESRILEELVDKQSDRADKLDHLGHMFPLALSLILKVLLRGLQKRVLQVGILPPSAQRWRVDEPFPSADEAITLGLNLDVEFAFSVMEKGPGANLPEALEFRKFWGKKSEVRRFKDGSICEAVVWHSGIATMQQRRLLLPSDFEYGSGEEASVRAIAALDALSKQLREVQDIPLEVSTVQGTSSVFRYCDVFPPVPSMLRRNKTTECIGNCYAIKTMVANSWAPLWVPPLDAVIQLGMSAKWPKDLDAVQRIKAAFYVKIAEELSKQFQLTAQAYPDGIDIVKREIALLKEVTTADGITKYRETPESKALEMKTFHMPKLTGALHGLHQQNSAFGPTCRLAKRWLSSQLLDPHHFPEMCIELLVASMFLAAEPYRAPNQPQVGFFRFLHLMANTDWNSQPLILNFDGEMNQNWFHSNRKILPTLFLSTPSDRKNSIWSKEGPTLQILVRVAVLARESLKVIESLIFSTQADWKQIFRPPLEAYDVVIHLSVKMNPLRFAAVDAKPGTSSKLSPYQKDPEEKIPVLGFNPAYLYLQELRTNFSEVALFFYDVYGGDVITVLWKPPALLSKEFKVSHINCYKPSEDGTSVELNVDSIVEDFTILGEGVVQTVKVQSSARSS